MYEQKVLITAILLHRECQIDIKWSTVNILVTLTQSRTINKRIC